MNMWVNLKSTSHEAIITTGTSSSDRIDFRYHQGTDDFGYLEYGDATSSGSYSMANYDTTASGWYMVTWVRDGLNWTHYIDGSAGGTHTATASTLPSDSLADGNWKIGQGGYTPESWTGDIDEMSFWNEALSSSDVTALYNSGSGTISPSTTNLIAHYDFEQTGSTLENQAEVTTTTPVYEDKRAEQYQSGTTTTTTAPFLYFDMEDTGSTSTNQGSGSSLDGTNTNISTSQTGKIGSYSYQFGGNSKVEDIGTTSSFADLSSSDFSVGFWHKDSSLSQYESIVSSIRFSQSGNGINITYGHPSYAGAFVVNLHCTSSLSAFNDVFTNNGIMVGDGNWHHYVFNFDNTNGDLTIYRDGSSQQTLSYANQLSSCDSTTNYELELGWNNNSGQASYLNGHLDDFAIWKGSVLTESEISSLADESAVASTVQQTSTPVYSYRNFADLGYAEDTERFVGQEFGSGAVSNTHGQQTYGDWGNIYQSGQEMAGMKLETANAKGVGELLDSFTITLKVNGGSPTGTVTGYVIDSTGTVATSSNTIDASTISGASDYTFNFDGTYQLKEDDRIVAHYISQGSSHYLGWGHTTSEAWDGADTVRTYKHSGNWNDDSSKDTAITIATSGTAYADLVGKSIDNVQLRLEKVGSPTGTAEVGVWNSANTKVHSFGNYDMSTTTAQSASGAGTLSYTDEDDTTGVHSGNFLGWKITAGHELIGKYVDSFSMKLNNHDSHTGTDTYTFEVVKPDGSVAHTFCENNLADMSSSYSMVTCNEGTYLFEENDSIGVRNMGPNPGSKMGVAQCYIADGGCTDYPNMIKA